MSLRASRSRLARLALLLGALALLLTGCDLPWQAKQSDKAKDQTLKMVWSWAAIYPDPAQAYGNATIQAINLLFDGLVTVDRNGRIEPWGATSWAISPDGLTYTFQLRPHQRFSDGTPIKPSDYAWSMDRVANPCTQSVVAYELAAIKNAAAFSAQTCEQGPITTLVGNSIFPNDGANTLTIQLAHPAGYFLAMLTTPPFFVVERSVVSITGPASNSYWTDHMSDGKTGQGGSGMYYVAAWTRSTLTLKQNPYWWGRQAGKAPHFTEIVISIQDAHTDGASAAVFDQFISDSSTAFSSDVTFLPDMPLSVVQQQSYYHEQPTLIMMDLLLNWKIAPFDDLNARKAFCLAIDRDQLNEQVFQGGNMPTWHLVPQGMPSYNAHLRGPDNAPIEGNATLARSYWQQYLTRHPSWQPPDMWTLFLVAPIAKRVIPLLQTAWTAVLGFHIKLVDLSGISIPAGAADEWFKFRPLAISQWSVDYVDPEDFLSLLYLSNSEYNTQNASVPAADALMRQADALPDLSQRIPLYQQAEQMLIDNVAVCPLFQYVNRYALRSWVKGDFVEDARGLFPNDAWITGYIAKH
ncbi:MAG TPA: peptide ABC transporter substrate-binding protein [Ktedonobacterales bacterium]|nr:peptide ABC transporter substrate-binding protein [Ktedonobacterales bacterium]